MAIDYSRKLTHKGQLLHGALSTDAFSDISTPTSVVTLNCYCYYENADRPFSDHAFSNRRGWTVILPKDTIILVDDILQDIRDVRHENRQVLAAGVVTQVLAYDHYRDGRQFVQAMLNVR